MRRPRLLLLALSILVLVPVASDAIGIDILGGPISTKTYVSLDQIPRGGMAHIAIEVRVNTPWHINAHKVSEDFLIPTEITFDPPEGIIIKEIVYPKAIEKELGFAEGKMRLYEGTIYIGAIIEVSEAFKKGKTTIGATLTYQACDDEKCLLPEEEQLFIPIVISDPHEAVDLTNAEVFENISFASMDGGGGRGIGGAMGAGGLSSMVASRGWFMGFLLVFLGGLALNLTPCVYPMIPITVSYFGGQGGGRGPRTVFLAVLYLLGMATMYSVLGLIAALTGSLFGSALQSPFVLAFIALVMVGLSLSMFGLYEIRIPLKLAGIAGTAKQGAAGSFMMGLTVGIVAAPCIGPFVLGLLTFVGEVGSPVLGFSLFFTLALGLGAPFVFLAIASGNISQLPKSGQWMEWIRKMFGVVLLGMALYFLRPVLGDPTYFGALGLLLVAGGVILGFIIKVTSSVLFFNAFRRFVGVAAPLYGLVLILTPGNIVGREAHDGIVWQAYDSSVLAAARAEGTPVLIDFSADWCLPCKELDHKTFSQPEVIEAAKPFIALKADLTRASSKEVVSLREQYKIVGVPTVVFIDKTGKERDDLRVVQFVDSEDFLGRLNKVTQ